MSDRPEPALLATLGDRVGVVGGAMGTTLREAPLTLDESSEIVLQHPEAKHIGA